MTTTIPYRSKGTDAFLSDEEYTILRVGNMLKGAPEYQPGTRVRLISASVNHSPGFHLCSDYLTVCRVEATGAEFVGIKKDDLLLCQPVTDQDAADHAMEFIAHMLYAAECKRNGQHPRIWSLIGTEAQQLYLRRAYSWAKDWIAGEASSLAAWNAFAKDLGIEMASAAEEA